MFLPGMTFLAENPEAFGFISDARPVATQDGSLIVTANGASGMGGMTALPGATAPTFSVEAPGVDGLIDELYGSLIPRTDRNHRLLASTFGESEGRQEHLVSRYAAVLAEATALSVLTEEAVLDTREGLIPMSHRETAERLAERIAADLSTLGRALEASGADEGEDEFLSVSFAAVRVTDRADGTAAVDLFAAGDFKLYLLDANGLCPLWVTATPPITPRLATPVGGTTLELNHPEPYALLLLSESACAPDPAEARRMREEPGLLWRHRMRLEENILRLLATAGSIADLGAYAERFFTGRAHGRDSASGAMILRPQDARESLQAACRARLDHLESLLLLLPDGYDPAHIPHLEPRVDTERAYLHALLTREEGLADRVTEALRKAVLDKLHRGLKALPEGEAISPGVPSADVLEPDDETLSAAACAAESTPPPADVPEYHRLSFPALWKAYRLYDSENDADRSRIAENRRALYEQFSRHWVTLRPLFVAGEAHDADESSPQTLAYRAACDRDYEACCRLNARLGAILTERRAREKCLDTLLSEGLEALRATRYDRLYGRDDDGRRSAFLHSLAAELPAAIASVEGFSTEEGDGYRSLYTAYLIEREELFKRDITPPHGILASTWVSVCNGTLSTGRWADLCSAAASCIPCGSGGGTAISEEEDYAALLGALRRISLGTGVLCNRVRERAADRRMARELATRVNLQLDCLRGAAYEDADWGEAAAALMSEVGRGDYAAMVFRWEEALATRHRRAEAYESYRAMYESFIPSDDGR